MKAGVRVRLPPTAAGTALAILLLAAGELAPCLGAVRCERHPPPTTNRSHCSRLTPRYEVNKKVVEEEE